VNHHLTLEFDRALVERGVILYWQRTVPPCVFIPIALALVYLVLNALPRRGLPDLLPLALLSIAGLGPFASLWLLNARAVRRWRSMGHPVRATLVVGTDALTITSILGEAVLPWSAIREVWRTLTFWVLLLSRGYAPFVTVPTTGMSLEVQRVFLERVGRADGRVLARLT
jgi:hypothetical protein